MAWSTGRTAFRRCAHRRIRGAVRSQHETFEDVAAGVPRFIEAYDERRLDPALGYLSPAQFEHRNARAPVETAA